MNATVAVVGLGYVGLPLAIEFGKHYHTIAYDVSVSKIDAYQSGHDPSGQLSAEEFCASGQIQFTLDPTALHAADVIIVAVPTPVDEVRRPDLRPLISAT